jgi:hypothetical protein
MVLVDVVVGNVTVVVAVTVDVTVPDVTVGDKTKMRVNPVVQKPSVA